MNDYNQELMKNIITRKIIGEKDEKSEIKRKCEIKKKKWIWKKKTKRKRKEEEEEEEEADEKYDKEKK